MVRVASQAEGQSLSNRVPLFGGAIGSAKLERITVLLLVHWLSFSHVYFNRLRLILKLFHLGSELGSIELEVSFLIQSKNSCYCHSVKV
jgi:hypothetical protein